MNDIGEEQFKEFKTWDMGDIVGVEGFVFKTRTGEITVHAQKITLLSKSLLPLPEKWHGLKDQDTRYRQRYVDLIVNPEVAETFRKRSKIIAAIRRLKHLCCQILWNRHHINARDGMNRKGSNLIDESV